MKTIGGWEVIEPPLGRGGQGTVYKARSPWRTGAIANSRQSLFQAIKQLPNLERISPRPDPEALLSSFISSMTELCRADDPSTELGALKKFDIPMDGDVEVQAAVERFEREVEALKSIQHPGILKLIEANVAERWFVTEYHPGGTLANASEQCRGDALSALKAFRSIVEAVTHLHEKGYVHRDIKSPNVFIAADGRLVLGDFGIVFFEDHEHTRITSSFERVGSRDWMAPWAHTGKRVDEVHPSFDVFPLGKLLWVMVAGRQILPPYRTHRSPGHKLEEMFPDRPGMEQINSILDSCIVTEEAECLRSAVPLLTRVDQAIQALEKPNQLALQHIVLTSSDGRFAVRLTARAFQLEATPLVRNSDGEWVAQGDSGPVNSRWHPGPNGKLVRFQ
jgi:serine/threonine protein kinase